MYDVPSILRGYPMRARLNAAQRRGVPYTNVHVQYDTDAAAARLARNVTAAEHEKIVRAALAAPVYRRVRVRDDELPYFVRAERERLSGKGVQVENKERERGTSPDVDLAEKTAETIGDAGEHAIDETGADEADDNDKEPAGE